MIKKFIDWYIAKYWSDQYVRVEKFQESITEKIDKARNDEALIQKIIMNRE